ncbi:formylglycine-generating enzyme family protein [Thiothrix nivea]|uniref:Sulphatase-modifying factor protein n=1 Tax=Thiothrix nivea (strain ATCC 35100 / DSM 5205 / JP2) TaxID=870187 RepID=A0A656HID7_THINJ|nr:formylglycine-generating enzyme family protein [Thiothrix nivea]EIJ35952.1 Sulphatase-modifying factor protein [Thiothrix nivea DSM 5205]
MFMTYRNYLSPPVFPYPWASDWGEDRHGLWQAFTYRDVRHAFRWIPPGEFDMGSPEIEEGRYDYEDLHHVTIPNGFWLAETTVTQALWQTVMDDNPSNFKDKNRPVERVSWDDAQTFIAKLNQIHPDLTVRLPWEAEWEYACRAGTKTPFNFGGKDDLNLEKVNYSGVFDEPGWAETAKKETTDVKTYPCNGWGLYEMHGNVWEWCEDEWRSHLGTEDMLFSPSPSGRGVGVRETAAGGQEQGAGVLRVVRGGSWNYYGRSVRSAIRNGNVPDFRNLNIGFRLALGHPELPAGQPGGGAAGRGAPIRK